MQSDIELQPNNELRSSVLGKILLDIPAASTSGKLVRVQVRGTKQGTDVLPLRKFQEELQNPNVAVGPATNNLELKNTSCSRFEKVLRISWPLER